MAELNIKILTLVLKEYWSYTVWTEQIRDKYLTFDGL